MPTTSAPLPWKAHLRTARHKYAYHMIQGFDFWDFYAAIVTFTANAYHFLPLTAIYEIFHRHARHFHAALRLASGFLFEGWLNAFINDDASIYDNKIRYLPILYFEDFLVYDSFAYYTYLNSGPRRR